MQREQYTQGKLSQLHAAHYYIVDRDVNQLNKKPNEAHHQETKTSGASNLCKLYRNE
jgi:hypothetical protein